MASIKHKGWKWSTADASNPTLVMVLDDTSKSVHITDASDQATDWNVTADSHPTVYIHSATTPATEYIKMYHDATNAYIDAVGGHLVLQIAGTTKLRINTGGNTTISGQLSCHNGLAIDTGARNDMYIIQATQGGNGGGLYVNSQGTGNLVLFEDGGVEKFRINPGGNTIVGGQLSCHYGLVIDTGARNDMYILSATQEGAGGGLYINNKGSGNLVRFDDNGTEKFSIDHLGNATFSDHVNMGSFLRLFVTATVGDTAGQIWYDSGSNKIHFYNGSAEQEVTSGGV